MRRMRSSAWHSGQRGYLTLIALLVVIVIIGILFATQYGGSPRRTGPTPRGESQTLLGGAVDRADATVCRNNLNQLRAAIQVYQANAQAWPPDLESLQAGVRLQCPVGREPYQYDPLTGAVHCMHPGHENF